MRNKGMLEFYRGNKRLQLSFDIDTGGRPQFILEHCEIRGEKELRSATSLTAFEMALADRVAEALRAYYDPKSTPGDTTRIDRLEAFAAELISGTFPHLAHLVPPAHLGDAVKALKGEA